MEPFFPAKMRSTNSWPALADYEANLIYLHTGDFSLFAAHFAGLLPFALAPLVRRRRDAPPVVGLLEIARAHSAALDGAAESALFVAALPAKPAADLNLRFVGFDGLGAIMVACAAACHEVHFRGSSDPGGGKGGALDALFDIVAVVSDGSSPPRLRPEFSSGDGLHPNAAEDRAMTATLDIAIIECDGETSEGIAVKGPLVAQCNSERRKKSPLPSDRSAPPNPPGWVGVVASPLPHDLLAAPPAIETL